MSFPAAGVGDTHVCPLVTGVVPHVGGAITPLGCAKTVFIGGKFAAVANNIPGGIVCVGPPNGIAKGSMTVMIENFPAARAMDLTLHGSTIIGPGTLTVLIGG